MKKCEGHEEREECEKLERVAKAMFRIVHGEGDAGSDFAFDCQNPALKDGWIMLAFVIARSTNYVQKLDYAQKNKN